ncbi:MAG: pssA [Phycisphaerales bacterium]|nr:pssA [Phycisphaerales bacterium]
MVEPNAVAAADAALAEPLPAAAPPSAVAVTAAYAVHLFTASGVVCTFLAAAEVCSPGCRPRVVFAWLGLQVLIDAADGPLARLCRIKQTAPRIDGRTIDDLVDYLSYTFVPLLLVWRMGWVPGSHGGLWVAPTMVASLFGFANKGAKDEAGGFFLGFPSYWNIVAVYAGLAHAAAGPWPNAALLVVLTVLTVLPVRFVYPNLAPQPWRVPLLAATLVWAALLAALLLGDYPRAPAWLVAASLVYPVLYVVLSVWLDLQRRRAAPATLRA